MSLPYTIKYGSYGLYIRKKRELSLLHATHLLVLLFIPTKYYQNISKVSKLCSAQGCIYGWTDGSQADRYIPRSYSVGGIKETRSPLAINLLELRMNFELQRNEIYSSDKKVNKATHMSRNVRKRTFRHERSTKTQISLRSLISLRCPHEETLHL